MNNKNLIIVVVLLCIPLLSNAQEKEEFKPHGKVVGEVFGDYYYKVVSDTALGGSGEYKNTKDQANAFALRRMYLGYVYYFSEKFSGKILLESSDKDLLVDDIKDDELKKTKRTVNVKNAYLAWNDIFSGSKLIIGAQATPTFSTFADKVWGYRMIEKNIMDFRKVGASNDFGVALTGNIMDEGVLSYYLMVGNGTKQVPENNRQKKIYASVTAKLMDKKLLLDAYFDYEPQSTEVDVITLKGFVGYQVDLFTIGVEPFVQTEDTVQTFGLTVFGRGQIIEDKLNIFARVDLFDPDQNVDDSGTKETFFTAGIDFMPMNKVHIVPNIWLNAYNNKSDEENRDTDIVARLTFRYKF